MPATPDAVIPNNRRVPSCTPPSNPRRSSSSQTPSRPTLSCLSTATVQSVNRSVPTPMEAAMPARMRRSLTKIRYPGTRNARSASSNRLTNSSSHRMPVDPMMSASHWTNSWYRPRPGRSPRHTVCIWYRLKGIGRSLRCIVTNRANGTVKS